MDEATLKIIPIIISSLSFCVAGAALGWNILRAISKPRLKVYFDIKVMMQVGDNPENRPRYGYLMATNWGPGDIVCNKVVVKYHRSTKFFGKHYRTGVMVPDNTVPLYDKLPKRMPVGDEMTQLFKYTKDMFLKDKITRIGLMDSFGKVHYASRKDVKEAYKIFNKDFD